VRRAQVKQITAEAHRQIYTTYGELIETLRAELADTRTELARARDELAEARSELAELRARVERYEAREAELAGQLERVESVQKGEKQ
jgi:septal ring factor EnvC (AmiA/AmiB activator)